MRKTTLTIYDNAGNAVRTVTALAIRIRFGTIRKLIAIIDPEAEGEVMNRIISAWDEVENILRECFPDLSQDEIDGLELAEVVQALVGIIQGAMEQMGSGGTPKNG